MSIDDKEKVVYRIISWLLFGSAASMLMDFEASSIVRFMLTCALCWFLYRRFKWARILLGVLTAVAGLGYVLIVIELPFQPLLFPIMIILAIGNVLVGYILLSQKYVEGYFNR